MSELDADDATVDADWQRRVVGRSLRAATKRSIDRGSSLVQAATRLLQRSNGDGFTVQDVADEAGQSLRTLYQYFESKDDLLLAVYEEAMRTYAAAISAAVEGLEDPLERLAGGIVATLRMYEFGERGVERGLSRLRSTLGPVDPELIARSQEPVTRVFRSLVGDAATAGAIDDSDVDGSTYLILALKSAFITSNTVGNDFGVEPPSVNGATLFVLRGLGVDADDDWVDEVTGRLELPDRAIVLRPEAVPARVETD